VDLPYDRVLLAGGRVRTYARNRFERCVQIARWLNHEFDIWEPGAVKLEWVDGIHIEDGKEWVCGVTFERGNKLIVQLSTRGCRTRSEAIDTLIHEAAHVQLWDVNRGLRHGKEFWVTFGRFMDAYHERGFDDSKSYAVE